MLPQLLPTIFSLPGFGAFDLAAFDVAALAPIALMVLPIAATTIAIASGIPQLLLLLRTRDAAGVSVAGWGTAAASYGAWITRSLAEGSFGTILVLGIPAVMTVAVMILAWFWGGDRRLGVVPFTMIGLILGAAIVGNDTIMTVMLASTAVWAYAPSIYAMWTAPDLRGNSRGTWVLSSAYGIVWGAYGFMLNDRAMLFNGAVNAVLAGAVLAGLLAVQRARPLTTLTTSTSQFAMITTHTAPFDIIGTHTASLGIVSTATRPLSVISTALVSTATAQFAMITTDMISTDTAALSLGRSAA